MVDAYRAERACHDQVRLAAAELIEASPSRGVQESQRAHSANGSLRTFGVAKLRTSSHGKACRSGHTLEIPIECPPFARSC